MKIGIISDIHSNLPAIQKIYDELSKDADEIYCLGDIVGYGPYPNECINFLRYFKFSVMGNHDAAVIGLRNYDDFNEYARFAIDWTKDHISPNFLEKLKRIPQILEIENVYLVHGSLRDPIEEYLINYYSVYASFELMEKKIAFFGHTHLAGAFLYSEKEREIYYVNFVNGGDLKLEKGYKYLINPGSVGQPRDGNWKASYAIYDTKLNMVHFRRVDYDVEEIQKYMQNLGFPKYLWERLRYGR